MKLYALKPFCIGLPIIYTIALSIFLYEIAHPDYPWLTQQANEILKLDQKSDVGFEWGAGRSTIYFAKRCKYLTSIEHDPVWYKKVVKEIKLSKLGNVRILLMQSRESYIGAIDSFEDGSLDFVLIDGLYRDECALKAIKKIKPGGLLIIDNVNWYFPSNSKSPNSRKVKDEFASLNWKFVFELLAKWRCIWTSNGVTDTLICIKPCVRQVF